MNRRHLLLLIGAASILPLALYWRLPERLIAGKLIGGNQVFHDIAIKGRIHSSPVIWRGGDGDWAFAVVTACGEGTKTIMALDAWNLRGKRLAGFPLATEGASEVPPGNQIIGGPGGAPWWIDRSGYLHGMTPDQEVPGGALAALSLIAAPPAAIVDTKGVVRGWVAVAADLQPMLESQDAVAVFNNAGRIIPGYPAALKNSAENQAAVVDPRGEFVWMMLKSGQVDGFRLTDGQRAAGYPSAAPGGMRPTHGYRLAASPDGLTLDVALGTAELLVVAARTGQTRRVPVANAKRITAVAYAGEGRYALDEGTGRLLALDGNAQEISAMPLGDGTGNLINNVALLPLWGKTPGLVILSVPQGDEQAQIEKLYAERITAADRIEDDRLVEETRRQIYGDRPLSAAEQTKLQDDLRSLHRGSLEQSMGIDALSEALAVAPVTRAQIVRENGSSWTTLVDDQIPNATPGTSFRSSPVIYPTLFTDPNTATAIMLLPLNAVDSNNAMVRVYTLN